MLSVLICICTRVATRGFYRLTAGLRDPAEILNNCTFSPPHVPSPPWFSSSRILKKNAPHEQHGTYQFHYDAWSSISNTAKNFIKRLLVRNPQERMSAAEVKKSSCMEVLHMNCYLSEYSQYSSISSIHSRQHLVFLSITSTVSTRSPKYLVFQCTLRGSL